MRQPAIRPFASFVGSCGVGFRGFPGFRGFGFVVAFALLFAVSAAGSSSAAAQILYGSITGNVSDQTGAALPGVSVEAANTGRAWSKTTTTDDRGSYSFIDLQPGVYTVTIKAASFQPVAHKNAQVVSNADAPRRRAARTLGRRGRHRSEQHRAAAADGSLGHPHHADHEAGERIAADRQFRAATIRV